MDGLHSLELDPLLGRPGHTAALLGNEAIVRGALEAGVSFAAGYPGTPSSEVTDSFARLGPLLADTGFSFEYSVNEKIALEMAFAASLAGVRSICAMKHLGLMVAGDPLSTIPYMGVVGGMVIVSAGDPSCLTSPNEQDQRHLGPMLHLVVVDPPTVADAHRMTRQAFELSEHCRLPVLMRITTRVAHSRASVRFGALTPPREALFQRDPSHFVPIPAHARKLRLEIPGRLERAIEFLDATGFTEERGEGTTTAIVASGAPAATCADLLDEHDLWSGLRFVSLAGLHPLPEDRLAALLGQVDRVLVVEELSPYVEDFLTGLAGRLQLGVEILGKRSGHFPVAFEYTPDVLLTGLREALDLGPGASTFGEAAPLPVRPPVLCAGCPHRSAYFAARTAFGKDQLFFSDIGCYTLGFGPPLETADALVCMGAGFTLAAGVARVTGERTVGFCGDSTFFHAGMPPLLNAIKEEANLVAVILDNQVTAMTGHQQSPTTPATAGGRPPGGTHAGVVRALGCQQVETVDPLDLEATIAAFERSRDATGVSVVVLERGCPLHVEAVTGQPAHEGTFQVDPSRCGSCGRSGCGVACDQGLSIPFERSMAGSRASREPPSAEHVSQPVAPCSVSCPLGLCVQGYAAHIAAGQDDAAVELIESRTPLVESVCRVCHRPCEDACVGASAGGPVAINDLKRFAIHQGGKSRALELPPDNGLQVAIVGAGPAGLSAAWDLRMRGYSVELFDAAERPGGLLRHGVPRYRLPLEALERDVERVMALGVDYVGGVRLGTDIWLRELLDSHHAVVLALGATDPSGLDVPGVNEEGPPRVVQAVDWLKAHRDAPTDLAGQIVVVVGGGNAGIDAARTARRGGAAQVTVIERLPRERLHASESEVQAAQEEGIALLCDWETLSLVRSGVPGLRCASTSGGQERELPADVVIMATGQTPSDTWLRPGDPVLEHGPTGALHVDPETCQTSHPGVFAAGDLTVQPNGRLTQTVTGAMAGGLRAAWGVDVHLRSELEASERPPPPRSWDWPVSAPPPLSVSEAPFDARAVPPERPAEERVEDFGEVVGLLDEETARAEAARCLACGQCGNCRICIDLFGCPAFYVDGGSVRIDPRQCSGCGVCARYCPNGAIQPVKE